MRVSHIGYDLEREKLLMKTRIIRYLAILLAFAMLFSTIACQRVEPEEHIDHAEPPIVQDELPIEQDETPIIQEEMEELFVSTLALASDLRDEFADTETVNFQPPMWNVPIDYEFVIDFEFCISCYIFDYANVEYMYEIFGVFSDPCLSTHLLGSWTYATYKTNTSLPRGHSRMYVRPGGAGSAVPFGRVGSRYFCVITSMETNELVEIEYGGELFIHQGKHETWGYLPHFYLGLKIDPVTGERLERPQVTIFTLENQLEAPQSEFIITEDGHGGFTWDPIEGAEFYIVVRIDADVTAASVAWPIGVTSDTTWIHPEVLVTNFMFNDTIHRAEQRGMPAENYSVIAVNSETHSALGNLHNGAVLASRLVLKPAFDMFFEEIVEAGGEYGYTIIPSIGVLPTHFPVYMTDGSIVYRRLMYNFEFGYGMFHVIVEYEDGDRDYLRINFAIEGTIWGEEYLTMFVSNIDPDTYEKELEAFKRLLEDAAPRGGGTTSVGISKQQPDADIPTKEDVPEVIQTQVGDVIYANSALSAFLAHNMIAGNEFIDLTEFPESANWDLLGQAFFEAMYQNPLILHVAGAGTIPGTEILVIEYRKPIDVIHQQQEAIREIIPQIIAEIITPGMTDLEKSVAINQFLVDTAEYDWAALENAELYDFMHVDPRYYDSFTAYGILINRLGVCSGYAAAFTLLAAAIGLESIVVTGYLEGFLPHAWNRVNIDGQWHTVDVTNNANEFLFNIFLHLPDDVASSVLVEDDKFVLDAYLYRYRSDSDENEYFRITDRFFDLGDIAAELAELINETGSATLRTDHDLNDKMFMVIVHEVLDLVDVDGLYGFHWLGVIYLTDGT